MDSNLFLKTIENFNELQIEVLYQGRTYKATDYNITEMLFALEPLAPINPDIDNRLWVRAENCKLLHF
jgi:hypothetical protein